MPDLCTPLPNGNQACVTTGDIVDTGPRECSSLPSGSTPPLTSVNVDFAQKSIDFYGESEVQVSQSFYVGVENNVAIEDACFWVGVEPGICAPVRCGQLPDPTELSVSAVAAEIDNIADDILDELQNQTGVPEPGSIAAQILKLALVAVLTAALFLVFTGMIVVPGPTPFV
jgi:hypothetical protein